MADDPSVSHDNPVSYRQRRLLDTSPSVDRARRANTSSQRRIEKAVKYIDMALSSRTVPYVYIPYLIAAEALLKQCLPDNSDT